MTYFALALAMLNKSIFLKKSLLIGCESENRRERALPGESIYLFSIAFIICKDLDKKLFADDCLWYKQTFVFKIA